MLGNLFDNLLVVVILFALFVLGYCKLKNKTIVEFFKEIMEILRKDEE